MSLPLTHYGSMNINEARLQAGFFVSECLELFEISGSTWHRWCRSGAPGWAFRLLECYAGHLDHLGWRGWQIRKGELYSVDLAFCYSWTPADMNIAAFNLTPYPMPASIRQAVNDSWTGERGASRPAPR